MTRLPGCALQVRGWVTGFFDRASCPGEKLARIHAGHPSGFPPPTRRVIRGPLRAKSQEPRAKSQEPRAKSQEPRAKSQEPRAADLLWERTCARQADGALHPSVPVAHKCDPTEKRGIRAGGQLVGSHQPNPRQPSDNRHRPVTRNPRHASRKRRGSVATPVKPSHTNVFHRWHAVCRQQACAARGRVADD